MLSGFVCFFAALQARSAYNSWEALSPDGFALNSKWNEAEKYICNPLSGQVPMECLSAKTLSGRSFRNITNRITMSAPLIYSSHTRPSHTNLTNSTKEDFVRHFPIPGSNTFFLLHTYYYFSLAYKWLSTKITIFFFFLVQKIKMRV